MYRSKVKLILRGEPSTFSLKVGGGVHCSASWKIPYTKVAWNCAQADTKVTTPSWSRFICHHIYAFFTDFYSASTISTNLQSLLRDYALSINDIVTRGEVQGIFDKWTWEGTGIFALTLALPIAVKGVQILKQRYAVNKVRYFRKKSKLRYVNKVSFNTGFQSW